VQRLALDDRLVGPTLARLPPESLHMTVFDLLCHERRVRARWSSRLPLDCPLEETDRRLAHWLEPVKRPGPLRMVFHDLGPWETTLHVRLRPADAPTAAALREFREAVARATGVRHPDHDTYRFHVSLAYRLRPWDAPTEAAASALGEEAHALLARALGTLELPAPHLALFPHMHAFPVVRLTTDGEPP